MGCRTFGHVGWLVAGVWALACSPGGAAPEAPDVGALSIDADGVTSDAGGEVGDAGVAEEGRHRFEGDAWADNWFSLARDGEPVAEDSVPITTERSFNAESIAFEASYPFTLAFVLKDFKQDDTGLEYIGRPNQQIGDGGFIFQLRDAATGRSVLVSSSSWRCLVIHRAPLDPSCEKDPDPSATCGTWSIAEPVGWKSKVFDDSTWPAANEHTAAAVGPKDGYDAVSWAPAARFIWSPDLKLDNTVLCRVTVNPP